MFCHSPETNKIQDNEYRYKNIKINVVRLTVLSVFIRINNYKSYNYGMNKYKYILHKSFVI